MSDALMKVANNKIPTHRVTELIDEKYLLEPPEFDGHYDPHVWMDVSGWMAAVRVVSEKLSEFDSANADYYKANSEAYLKELEALDAYAKKSLASVPENRRILITAHDAFNYFGRAYGLRVMGIQGISTESEAGLKRIRELIDLIVEKDVTAVFTESSVSEKNVRALLEGAKQRGKAVKLGGSLFSDAMGKQGTYEGTYIGMIDHNVTTVTRALGGTAPEKGMNGKLSGISHE